MKHPYLIILFSLFAHIATAQKQQNLQDSVQVFFNEVKTAADKKTKLWNKDVYGSMLFVNPKTRQIYANESDTAGVLEPKGDIYMGVLPKQINIANTAISWSGKRWAMVMLPLPQNKYDRINLLAHELFHSVQPSLGFELSNIDNNHLDLEEGRIYLRLELEALKKAIQCSSKKELRQHLTNALTFRKYRYTFYEAASRTENQLELNEGLAEFTGLTISHRDKNQTTAFFVEGIDNFFRNPTFVRSFAYYTTPAYGYLLYKKDKNWTKKVDPQTELTNYFINAFNIQIPTDLKNVAEKIATDYNGRLIMEEEKARAEKTKKLIATYKLKFVDQPHFEIQFEKMNVSFDPRNIVPLEDKGTVYPNIRVTDLWGVLTVENGALMSPNWDKISITNPVDATDKKIIGDGWIIELKDGYFVEKDALNGNFKLKKKL
ncbi:hypothetical protein [Pedobacter namyangjuensis]|uniref:hypothetical protein n=1 Tax=Pedobacter namyangjuensis TaxID=600626 RepID=UPI000DE48E55|nr:hypothetical protein [Pedobacter namyangjuensis]